MPRAATFPWKRGASRAKLGTTAWFGLLPKAGFRLPGRSPGKAKYWADPKGFSVSAYLERPAEKTHAVDEAITRMVSGWRARLSRRTLPRGGMAEAVAAIGATLANLPDDRLLARATALRARLLREGFVDALVAEGFALLREATRREKGIAHRAVQIHGAHLLLQGSLLEMATGEGKTVTALLAAGTAALAGLRVHVVTVNDYLATRDFEELGPIYRRLGLTVAVVGEAVALDERPAAYAAEIVYVNNKDVTFDYLRDRLALGTRRSRARATLMRLIGTGTGAAPPRLNLRGLDFAIVDEADSVLIDEAKTPLIISAETGDADADAAYRQALDLARSLKQGVEFELSAKDRSPRLTAAGRRTVAEQAGDLGGEWAIARAREERITQALSALHVFRRDQDYIVAEEKIQIVDEYTGRVMADRSWEAGLHQMIEAKEGVPLTGRRRTIARITYQRFFRRYRRLSGMTGTGMEVAGELEAQFHLRTRPVPTHRPVVRRFLGLRLVRSAAEKWALVTSKVAGIAAAGRPVLIGVRSVEASEALSRALDGAGIAHTVLNARQDAEEAAIVARAGGAGIVTVATNMAGRGTDIKLAPGVAEAGGLHVILTEFHESSRVDRQLYGRAGRQGDPGSCEAVVALDDDLFAHYAGLETGFVGRVPALMASERASRLAGGVLQRLSQYRAERSNAAIRRLTVKNDTDTARMLAFSGRPE